MAAGIFLVSIIGFAAGLQEAVADLYREREAEIAALVFSDRLSELYEREDSLQVYQCKKMPRARGLEETWTCSGVAAERILLKQSSLDGRECSVALLRRDLSVERISYKRDGIFVKRETVSESLVAREKRVGETAEYLDPSTCMRFLDQVRARYVSW